MAVATEKVGALLVGDEEDEIGPLHADPPGNAVASAMYGVHSLRPSPATGGSDPR